MEHETKKNEPKIYQGKTKSTNSTNSTKPNDQPLTAHDTESQCHRRPSNTFLRPLLVLCRHKL